MNASKQPSLAELTGRTMVARANRVEFVDSAADVEPHEVLAGIRVDSQVAWADAQLAPRLLGLSVSLKSPPSEWAAFADWNPGRLGIPMAAGQFPQRLREIAGLFAANLEEPKSVKPVGFASMKAWIAQQRDTSDAGTRSLAEGISREFADAPVSRIGTSAAERNEQAADLWFAGKREAALTVWQSMAENPVVSFNIGMALLMLGRAELATPHLRLAEATLPTTSGWQNLAALYLTVAQIRQ